ncbi:hypothetical protein [Methanococcus maripaludis]|uniref:Uncharacterized protein n=1 Tax=Methanococcus maripaludis TaxID=39152 RepID=A0A2L1CB99_METMI|nr:hypothetical protein [Methanococcus maripaludis]AVB76641.1 hypothetical protein MMJJ_12600 [Methanococcus maripaludis]MBA2863150.1 hypothetical protein [Methanococcus maripaludis]MBB6496845.1 hypothetical protein [Methanococcus maripaludis]
MINTKVKTQELDFNEIDEISNDLKRPYRGNNAIKYAAYAFNVVVIASLFLH